MIHRISTKKVNILLRLNKTSSQYILVLWIGMILLLASCGVTHQVDVQTVEPAKVDLSSGIRRIGIINESIAGEIDQETGELEAWVRYSDKNISEAAKDAALMGLFNELIHDTRFDSILVLEQESDLQLSDQQLDGAIPWERMAEICKKYEVDALFALAFHETDTRISLKKTKMEKRNLLRERIQTRGHEITLETLIENGWRIYDPFNKSILDEITLKNQLVSKAKGEDPIEAFQAIEDRRDSVLSFSAKTGSNFGSRLQPHKQTISRPYYIKGSDNLQKANEMAEAEDWQGAAALWKLDMAHTKSKVRSRAFYNMAVINEVHGDLESALELATKSNEVFESKLTKQYVLALNDRIKIQQQLEEQFLQ
ncbi:MAG: DUF6340 family protein [Flavobacteriaceae bacterium]